VKQVRNYQIKIKVKYQGRVMEKRDLELKIAKLQESAM
jgi:hypothetical protein